MIFARKSLTKNVHWSKSFNPLSQTSLKASQVADKYLKASNIPDLLIKETHHANGYFTSGYRPNVSELLEAGEKFLGKGYKTIGNPKDGVYRSADGLRQLRLDSNSLAGKHNPWVPHVHFEKFRPENLNKSYVNNHIPFIE